MQVGDTCFVRDAWIEHDYQVGLATVVQVIDNAYVMLEFDNGIKAKFTTMALKDRNMYTTVTNKS